ncbi:phage portal protein [Algoriphagus aestuarii]|nr:phage portal protein [Algoriphagus aestuarii]
MLEILRLDHILISIPPNTRELAREFYVGKLNFIEIEGDHPHGAIWIKAGDIEIHIREEAIHQTQSVRHSAFQVKDLKATKELLLSKNIEISFSTLIEGRDRCFFRDPWGNRFELIEFIKS